MEALLLDWLNSFLTAQEQNRLVGSSSTNGIGGAYLNLHILFVGLSNCRFDRVIRGWMKVAGNSPQKGHRHADCQRKIYEQQFAWPQSLDMK